MPYWFGYSIYSSQYPSTSVSPSLAAKETDISTRILGAIYTVPRPIRHNPGVSLPLIISGHRICCHQWLSRSDRAHFSLIAR